MSNIDTPVIIDVGTGYTKLGYSTNNRPDYIIPTLIGNRDLKNVSQAQMSGTEDLDFYIGYEAIQNQTLYPNTNIMKHGQIEDWDKIEQFWEQCLFKYLRCEPEDHPVLLTEPPLNSPDNREYTAEIMFETFNVPYLYIGMQAMLAIAASWTKEGQKSLTGCVVDSGDGVTHVIPVVEGYPISNAIQHVPVAGREMTLFIADLLKDREPQVPPEDRFNAARDIKERFCKVAKHPSPTFAMFDKNRSKYIEKYHGVSSKTGKPFECEVGYERFLAPEVWFSPELVSSEYTTPISVLIDRAIQLSPITNRMQLYNNIVLSGGSTTFKGLAGRLQGDVQVLVDERLRENAERESKRINRKIEAGKVPVRIVEHRRQQYAVWYGGAMLAQTGKAFLNKCHTKMQYDEVGPSIARASAMFGDSAV
ncbi:Actin-like protein 3 [Histomonas meleagridis]|uniref:Actin-like protein 3 n=1 Tax=Histomonas meleagridis TaxID=135588 RepID=UPI003559B921|nr:Actin-like protein 3 [Histomonas meleagridis]KAH0807177.1 Actin-like protein 3 [Histomonas meleagridis]